MKASAGDGVSVAAGAWRFDGAVPDVFDQHVAKSIPRYADGHDLVVELARPLLASGGRCYELGCSTGTLTAKLGASAEGEHPAIVGLDQVEGMLERALARCRVLAHVRFEQADVTQYRYEPARVVVSYYTLHFVPTEARAALVRRLYEALEPGGLLLLFEKVRDPDPSRDRALTAAYHAFKERQGITQEEIRAKAAALQGILVPQTEGENLEMLRGEEGLDAISPAIGVVWAALRSLGLLARF